MITRGGKSTGKQAQSNLTVTFGDAAQVEESVAVGANSLVSLFADAKFENQVKSAQQNFQTAGLEMNVAETDLPDADPNVNAQLAAALLREVAYKAKEAASQAKAQNDKETFDAKLAETKETFDAQLAETKETFGTQLAKEKETFDAQLAKANEETAAAKEETEEVRVTSQARE